MSVNVLDSSRFEERYVEAILAAHQHYCESLAATRRIEFQALDLDLGFHYEHGSRDLGEPGPPRRAIPGGTCGPADVAVSPKSARVYLTQISATR